MAAQFDAGQYGFFGGAPPTDDASGLLSELEGEGGGGGEGGGAGGAGEAPPRPRSDPGVPEGGQEGYHLWAGAMLPDELDSKLTLGEGGGRGSAPPTAPASLAAGSPPGGAAAPAAAQQAGQQPQGAAAPGDLASLWGNAQVRALAAMGA